ncbi:MAG: hypothetical protein PHS57_08035 [Alphaproteobacteria bacterium]|nr:hypothetical protein [Alphaproteobacteria bacterium]
MPKKKSSGSGSTPFWVGLTLSLAWIGSVIAVLSSVGASQSFAGISLADWAVGISAIVSPVAMVWMVTAYLQRAADVQSVAGPLRRQLMLITGESGTADARIRRFNQAIKEQVELLKTAQNVSQEDWDAVIDRVQQHRADLERFESVSGQQLKEIQDVVRRSMFQIEQMMDDKFTMLRVLDGKLKENGEGMAQRIGGASERIATILGNVEESCNRVAGALEHAQQNSQKLADMSRLQESSLTNAASAAAETLGGLSSKIDLSVARFLERASSAREEADRMAETLDAQTRALDDLSSTLPTRVSDAESVLRGVADRLYASEQAAHDQAVSLSDGIARQIDSLESSLEQFVDRMSGVDAGIRARQSDLNDTSDRVNASAVEFFSSWERSVEDLNDRLGNTLVRFTVVNDETRKNAEVVTEHLNETTGKYEDVVTRMRVLSDESGTTMKALTDGLSTHLAQFEALSDASSKAGEEVQARATVALQNLQAVLNRVEHAKDLTQTVGRTLVDDIRDAVEKNEAMIARLNAAAQKGVETIGAATNSFVDKEGDVLGKARASETVLFEAVQKLQEQAEATGNTLRDQTANLMNLLAEAQGQLLTTDQKLQSFAAQAVEPVQRAMERLDASAEHGLLTLGSFGEGVSSQVERLEDFHARIDGLNRDMVKVAAESVGSFESLSTRFVTMRTEQEESARQALTQFTEVSNKLHSEVSGLDNHAAQAIEVLQQAAVLVGEQSYQVMEKAKSSGSQVREVAAALQAEASKIQEALRQEAGKFGDELANTEARFTSLGDVVRDKAETARGILEATATQYNQVTEALDHSITLAHGKIEALHTVLGEQVDHLGSQAVTIGKHASEITASGGYAIEKLSQLNERMVSAREGVQNQSRAALSSLDDTASSFEVRTLALSQAAQAATEAVVQAGDAMDQQTDRLSDGGKKMAGMLDTLTASTATLSEKMAAIRLGMEQQNVRLLEQLNDSIGALEKTGTDLHQIVTTALTDADQASTRYETVSGTIRDKLTDATETLSVMAARSDKALSDLSINMTKQAATMGVIGDQIGEQQRLLSEANDKHRTQLLGLFDQLNAAHVKASDVAEQSISSLAQLLTDIDQRIGDIGTRTQTAVGNVKIASLGFSEQSELLMQNAQAAEQQARSVLQISEKLREEAQAVRVSLQAENDRASESLGVLLGRLTEGNAEVQTVGANANEIFLSIKSAMDEQTGNLSGVMDDIAERQRILTTALDAQRDTIGGLLDRLTTAQDQTASVAEKTVQRLSEGAQTLTRNVETIDARAQDALTNVQKASAGLAYEAEAIGQGASQAAKDSQEILASAGLMHERLETLRSLVREEGDRANDIFGSVMDRIKDGATDLRDLSTTTGKSLEDLNQNVTQQSAILTESIKDLDGRQGSLLTSLHAQREAITGLLTRFGKAQEETADLAEKTAARLNEEAQSITSNIDKIGAQASTTLASVQSSVGGFAEQVSAIKAQSEMAEQRVVQMLDTTADLQEKARMIDGSMQTETEHIVSLMSDVIAKLDVAGEQLKARSAETAETLDRTAARTSSVAELGADLLQTQAQTINTAIDAAEERIVKASETVSGHLIKVNEASGQVEAKTRQLADASEFAAKRLDTLRAAVVETDKVGRDTAIETYGRIEELKTALQDQMQRLIETSKETSTHVLDAVKGLETQSDVLKANLASSEAALMEASSLVRDEANQLPSVLQRSVTAVEQATTTLKDQSSDTDRALISLADRFISVTSGARTNIADEMTRVSKMADEAGKILTGFNQLLGEQVGSMQQSAAMLSGEQKDLVEKASSGVDALSEASQRLSVLRSEAISTAERLVHDFDTLDQRAATTGGRLAQAGEGIAKQVESITQATEYAEGCISGVGNALREHLESIRGGLQTQIDEINHGLIQITAQLERTGTNLRSVTVGAVADVERVGKRFEETGSTASVQMNAETEKMRKVTEEVAGILTGFGEKFDQMIDHMAQAGADMKLQEGDAIGHIQRMLGHLGSIAERLESARTMSGNVSRQAIERLDEVVTVVQAQMSKLTSGAQTAAGIMRGIGQIYTDQTTTLTKGIGEAHNQVLDMNKSIDTMQQRTDRMRSALKLQGEDLMKSLHQILTQLEMTGDGLTDAVGSVLQKQGVSGKKSA